MKRNEVRMKVKQILACILIAGSLAGVAAVNCDVFDDFDQHIKEDPVSMLDNADPNDTKVDNANGMLSIIEDSSFTTDDLLNFYDLGKMNIHHLAQAYIYDPVRFAGLEEYAKQSYMYDEYKEIITDHGSTTSVDDTNNDDSSENEKKNESSNDEITEDAIQESTISNASAEDDESSWDISDSYEPTCTEDGAVVYMNSKTGEIKKETQPALGHDEGKWIVTKQPTLFTPGEKELRCTKDHVVLDKKKTSPIIPIWCIGLAVIVILVMIFLLVNVHLKKNSNIKPKLNIKK